MRSWHRDVGFFVFGLIIIYSLSGIILINRDTNFLKHDTFVEKTISPNMDATELGKELHIKKLKILRNEGVTEFFQEGTYNKMTGEVKYTKKELPSLLLKFNALHKSPGNDFSHWFSTIFGILLFFLAISSLWMFKTNTKTFRKGIFLAGIGIVVAILLLVLQH
jgi:hypothetical protein